MYTLVLIVGSFVLWIASEKTLLHFSRTARRVFWYLLACAIGLVLVRWLQSIEGVGMMWVFLSAIMAASMIEDEVVKSKGLTLMEIEATRRLRARLRTPEAQGKAERLMDIVGTISHGRGATLGGRQLWARMSGTMRRLRRALHTVLEQAEADELNYILCTINAPAMVEVCSKATLALLTGDRLPELTTETRAVLVDALQKIGMRYRPQRQLWAAAVLLNTRGLELTYLKNYLDDGGDYHTTTKLIYNDLQGELQQQVLEHVTAEGEALMVEFARLAPGGPPGVVLKLLSDVDDTVFSSGGSFPAGSDTRYPKKCYYPGALCLYAELDRCFAKRHQQALLRLRAMQRQRPRVLLPPVVAPAPQQQQDALAVEGPAGGSGDERTPTAAEQQAEPGLGLQGSSSNLTRELQQAAEQQAGDGGGIGGGAGKQRLSAPIPVPPPSAQPQTGAAPALMRHSSSTGSSFGGRPPRSPRVLPPSRRPLPLSPHALRGLPAGDPLSPAGASPESSTGALAGMDSSSSLAGSTWGASSLARGGSANGASEQLADTLTSRLRPLVTSAPGGAGGLPPRGSGGGTGISAFALYRSSSSGFGGSGVGGGGGGGEQPVAAPPPPAAVQPHQEGSNLVFLSARPESYKGMTESEAYRKYFQPFVLRGDLDNSPTMLLGAMTSGPKALLQWLGVVTWFPALAPPEDPKTAVAALYQQLAAKKLSRFREFAAIYPEACFVLIGDNGQGDVLCAEILWSSMRQNLPPGARSRLLCSLMHKVVPAGVTYSMLRSSKTSKTDWQGSWQQRGLTFSKSHVGMALVAYEQQLLDLESLHRVCIAAAADFRRVWARYGGRHAGRNLGKALKHLNADLRTANYVLPSRLQVPPLAIPGLAEGESLRGSRLPPPSPARSEALSDFSTFGPAVLH